MYYCLQNVAHNILVIKYFKLLGRIDVKSGYFGAAMHVSSVAMNIPDDNASQFDFINRSANGAIGDLERGMNVIYFVNYFLIQLASRLFILEF